MLNILGGYVDISKSMFRLDSLDKVICTEFEGHVVAWLV